jgi:hypothetical protein
MSARSSRGNPSNDPSDEALLSDGRLVLAAAARLAAEGNAVEVVTPWRPGLTREVTRAAANSGTRMWIRRSGGSVVARFAPADDEGSGTFGGLTPA